MNNETPLPIENEQGPTDADVAVTEAGNATEETDELEESGDDADDDED